MKAVVCLLLMSLSLSGYVSREMKATANKVNTEYLKVYKSILKKTKNKSEADKIKKHIKTLESNLTLADARDKFFTTYPKSLKKTIKKHRSVLLAHQIKDVEGEIKRTQANVERLEKTIAMLRKSNAKAADAMKPNMAIYRKQVTDWKKTLKELKAIK